MKRNTLFGALGGIVLLIASGASGQDADPMPLDTVAPPQVPSDLATSVQEADEVAKQAAEMQELLAQPPDKLNELTRQRAFKALAALGPARRLAKWSARLENVQTKRLDWLSKAEQAEKKRDELRAELESEMDQIRHQFADDEAECDRQLMFVINAYRPRFAELRDEADHWADQVAKTDKHLVLIRRNVVRLERDVRLAERGLPFRSPPSPATAEENEAVAKVLNEIGVDFDLSELGIKLDIDFEKTVPFDKSADLATTAPENHDVQQAKAELEKLFK